MKNRRQPWKRKRPSAEAFFMQKPAWQFAAAAVLCSLTLGPALHADEGAQDSLQVGSPTRVEVFPKALKLSGPRSRMQLVVTGHYADGSVQDLTRASQFASTSADIVTIDGAVALPHHDGKAEIAVIAGGRAAVVPVEVAGYEQPQPVSFEYDALAALSKQGCNSGACHGSPAAKAAFP